MIMLDFYDICDEYYHLGAGDVKGGGVARHVLDQGTPVL
jgi:hypothetical protein